MRSRRMVTLVAALLSVTLSGVLPAAADGHGPGEGETTCNKGTDTFGCETGDTPDDEGGEDEGGNGKGKGNGGDPRIFTVDLGTHPETGEPCWEIRRGGSQTWAEAADLLAFYDTNDRGFRACPAVPRTPPVEAFWESMTCPPPPPTPIAIEPGYAISGQKAFLEIRGPQTVAIACLGETITATARYVVRWGDGEETHTTSRGGPWPDGDLHHTYTDAGAVTVVVEAYWTGVWGATTFPELPVPTRAELDLEIRQVQAVRQR